ncbi:MAG: hypothetical protein ABIP21_02495 [Acidimicrobiia bacterium]
MVRRPHFRAEHPLDEVRALGVGAFVATLVRDPRSYLRRLGLWCCAVVTVRVLLEQWSPGLHG